MKPEQILEQAGVRVSAVRILVLRALYAARKPVSGMEIETALESVDRSSISRTLGLFASHGVVHTVDDGSGSVKYEVCRDLSSTHAHSDEHPHFHCEKCGTTICLDQTTIPTIELPDGFEAHCTNFVIKGLCPKCR